MGNQNLLTVPKNGAPIPSGYHESVRGTVAKITNPKDILVGCANLEAAIAGYSKLGMNTKELGMSLAWAELRLGELLGKPPGKGPGRGHKKVRTTDLLDKRREAEFRRMAYPKAHRNVVEKTILDGKWKRSQRLTAVDEYLASLHTDDDEGADLDIREGDFREVLADVKDESVSLILTDPPYSADSVVLYDELARFAVNVLKPGGSLLAYSGHHNLPDVINVMGEAGLRYWWTIALQHAHGSQRLPGKWVMVHWKPIVWFVNKKRGNRSYVRDMIGGSKPKKHAMAAAGAVDTQRDEWAQGEEELYYLISQLTSAGDLIVDPFAGTGTTGRAAVKLQREFIGAELRGELIDG